eukprot:m.236078 g.236078  ORF g.236078 m.236078 type:complete len:317 (+) comp19347_c0_seq20:653-1603(+)
MRSKTESWLRVLQIATVLLIAALVVAFQVQMNSGDTSVQSIPTGNHGDVSVDAEKVPLRVTDQGYEEKLLMCTKNPEQVYESVLHKAQWLSNRTMQLFPKHKWDPGSKGIFSRSHPFNYQGVKTRFFFEKVCEFGQRKYPKPVTVCEVGFMAGHTAQLFLETLGESPPSNVVSFDLGTWPWARPNGELLRSIYGNRHTSVFGDSRKTIAQFASSHKDVQCDIVFIDGAKDESIRFSDINQFRKVGFNLHKLNLLFSTSPIGTGHIRCVSGVGSGSGVHECCGRMRVHCDNSDIGNVHLCLNVHTLNAVFNNTGVFT